MQRREKAGGRTRSWLRDRSGENLREIHGEFGARHDFVETRGLGLLSEVSLHVGEKTDHAQMGLRGTQALDGLEGGEPGVQINDDEAGQGLQELQQRLGSGGDFHLEAEMLRGFGQLHLKEKVVHISYDTRHSGEAPRKNYRIDAGKTRTDASRN